MCLRRCLTIKKYQLKKEFSNYQLFDLQCVCDWMTYYQKLNCKHTNTVLILASLTSKFKNQIKNI